MDPLGTVFVATLKDGICQNCTVLAGKVDLEFEDGRPADISGGVWPKVLRKVHLLTPYPGLPAPCPHRGQVETSAEFCTILSLGSR